MRQLFLLLLVFSFSFSSCEKDDICDANTPTTPRMVIKFYDINNPTVQKNVSNLKVVGEEMKDGIVFNPTATGDFKYWTSGNTISIPLKTNATTTTFSFTLNANNAALINTDIIKFNYSTNQIYVSRACGLKTLFEIDPKTPFEHTDNATADQKWMRFVSLQKTNIINENETHLYIFF